MGYSVQVQILECVDWAVDSKRLPGCFLHSSVGFTGKAHFRSSHWTGRSTMLHFLVCLLLLQICSFKLLFGQLMYILRSIYFVFDTTLISVRRSIYRGMTVAANG